MLTEIGGRFVKVAFAGEVDVQLDRGRPERPPARFNRPGQDALYLSPDAESARVAIGQYVRAGDPPRVLVTYDVARCRVLDLRAPAASNLYELACQPWQSALAAGETPKSWEAADSIRQAGHAGLIDPSRRRPGLWHVALFRWNEPGTPTVRRIGAPIPVTVVPGQN